MLSIVYYYFFFVVNLADLWKIELIAGHSGKGNPTPISYRSAPWCDGLRPDRNSSVIRVISLVIRALPNRSLHFFQKWSNYQIINWIIFFSLCVYLSFSLTLSLSGYSIINCDNRYGGFFREITLLICILFECRVVEISRQMSKDSKRQLLIWKRVNFSWFA